MAAALFTPAVAGVALIPLMIFHQIQLMACAALAQRYAQRPDIAARERLETPPHVRPPLSDRIALVTGASRGIGRAAALALADAGAHIVAVAPHAGRLEALDDEIRALTGQPATLVPMDIGEGDGLDQLGLAIHQRFGRLDILVPRRRDAGSDDAVWPCRSQALGPGRSR